jgi:hypothetical protein
MWSARQRWNVVGRLAGQSRSFRHEPRSGAPRCVLRTIE